MSERLQERSLPPQLTMSLLDYLTSHALDEDYETVAARRTTAPRLTPTDADGVPPADHAHPDPAHTERGGARHMGIAALVAFALFALLLVMAASQTDRDAGSDAAQRAELLAQVRAEQKELAGQQQQVSQLRTQTQRLQREQIESSDTTASVEQELDRLGIRAGITAVTGPGVKVVVDNAPGATTARNEVLDSDLQKLANGLWEAGAEAISINGQRLGTLSAIREAGGAITVDNRSLRHPYTVLAIGDPEKLPARFADSSSGQAWLDLEHQVGLRFSMTAQKSLHLPAGTMPDLSYAATLSEKGAHAPQRSQQQ